MSKLKPRCPKCGGKKTTMTYTLVTLWKATPLDRLEATDA